MGDGEEQPVHPLRRRIEELDFDGDTETARRLAEEGRRTVDRQLEALEDVDAKAISLLKLNLVIVSAVLTISSLTAEVDAFAVADLNNRFNVVAVTSLVLSAALAATTYTASDSEVGMESRAVRHAIDASLSERELEVATAQSYAAWIDFNDRSNALNVLLITLTTLLVVVAIVHFALGTYAAIDGPYTTVGTLLGWTLLIGVGILTGLPRQLIRAASALRGWQ